MTSKQEMERRNIGILGGSFDPFHLGHLSIMEAAEQEGLLDWIVLMPARVSPFKQGLAIADAEDRIAMLQSVAASHPKVSVSRFEVDREQVSYTYDTLDEIQRQYPEDRIWFLVGSDSLQTMETWHRGPELLKHFSFLLAPRPGYNQEETERCIYHYQRLYGTEIRVLHNRLRQISSTEIKENLKKGESIDSLVPKSVADYIYEHRLYQSVH